LFRPSPRACFVVQKYFKAIEFLIFKAAELKALNQPKDGD